MTSKAYLTGFMMSLSLTVTAFILVYGATSVGGSPLSQGWLIAVIASLAVCQLVVQGMYFLHLSSKGKPGRSLQIMLFVLVMAAIVVGGSIWVMHNLNYRMMPGEQKVTETIQDKENIHNH